MVNNSNEHFTEEQLSLGNKDLKEKATTFLKEDIIMDIEAAKYTLQT